MSFSAMAPKCRVAPVELTLAQLQEMGSHGFPGLLGIEFPEVGDGFARARLELHEKHMAPNGYLHAGAVVGFADSACGYGCILNLPDGATGFTTIELKTNFLRSAQTGTIDWRHGSCTAAGPRRSGTRPCPTPKPGAWRSSAVRS
jgi:uncharacterized protein (TIGR00369 family)